MSRIKVSSSFPDNWKRGPDQGHELWVETYWKDNMIFQVRGGTPMLAMISKQGAREIRDLLNEFLGEEKSPPQE